MPLFADMLARGMTERCHQVAQWTPKPCFFRLPAPRFMKKWLGYVDQYLVFPLQVRWWLREVSSDTLFVFADQALGPWVPLVKHRPHVIHCHDFIALHSAQGLYPQNPVSFTGRLYQAMIRRGFSQGKNFISVSQKTRDDLRALLPAEPALSTYVYNGLNFPFTLMAPEEAYATLAQAGWQAPPQGFLMHVGGNQWYKNRTGVLHIYRAYCELSAKPLPMCMVGAAPSIALRSLAAELPNGGQVEFVTGLPTQALQAAYSLAKAMLFPSIAEGFGWPIAEAMACGCPVLTTGEAPMSEIGGDAAAYLPSMPATGDISEWASRCALKVQHVLDLTENDVRSTQERGFRQAAKFNSKRALDDYAEIYTQVFKRAYAS